MFIPRWLLTSILNRQDELERRVKRLELMALSDAENKIASLRDAKAGTISETGVSTIEEIVDKGVETR